MQMEEGLIRRRTDETDYILSFAFSKHDALKEGWVRKLDAFCIFKQICTKLDVQPDDQASRIKQCEKVSQKAQKISFSEWSNLFQDLDVEDEVLIAAFQDLGYRRDSHAHDYINVGAI
mmetsp:Transcript_50653/g.99200  ORF Transcript_50653/g.99200 Transcript_50653/m.99200 type:complete len:118 (-) Transcript_50653:379-732(-)